MHHMGWGCAQEGHLLWGVVWKGDLDTGVGRVEAVCLRHLQLLVKQGLFLQTGPQTLIL